MNYPYLTHSISGFIQQTAVCYVQRGYWFYLIGHIPKDKNPLEVDQKLLEKYQIGLSKFQRCHRKKQGIASVQYLRYRNTFLLLATEGNHPLLVEEKATLRDARTAPIRIFGYSIQWQNGRVFVSLDPRSFTKLQKEFLELALRLKPHTLAAKFWAIRFEPYRPVYHQVKSIWKTVNLKRKTAGLPPVPYSALRHKRRICRPFQSGKEGKKRPIGQASELKPEQEPRTARLRPLRGP